KTGVVGPSSAPVTISGYRRWWGECLTGLLRVVSMLGCPEKHSKLRRKHADPPRAFREFVGHGGVGRSAICSPGRGSADTAGRDRSSNKTPFLQRHWRASGQRPGHVKSQSPLR